MHLIVIIYCVAFGIIALARNGVKMITQKLQYMQFIK